MTEAWYVGEEPKGLHLAANLGAEVERHLNDIVVWRALISIDSESAGINPWQRQYQHLLSYCFRLARSCPVQRFNRKAKSLQRHCAWDRQLICLPSPHTSQNVLVRRQTCKSQGEWLRRGKSSHFAGRSLIAALYFEANRH